MILVDEVLACQFLIGGEVRTHKHSAMVNDRGAIHSRHSRLEAFSQFETGQIENGAQVELSFFQAKAFLERVFHETFGKAA